MEKCVNKAFEKGYREETNEDKRTDRGRNVILFVLALNRNKEHLLAVFCLVEFARDTKWWYTCQPCHRSLSFVCLFVSSCFIVPDAQFLSYRRTLIAVVGCRR